MSENDEYTRAQFDAGNSAVQSALLINGGAAAGLLAFAGHLAPLAKAHGALPALVNGLHLYAVGVLLAAVSASARYVSLSFHRRNKPKPGEVFNWISIILVIASCVLFAVGTWMASAVFTRI
jgi:uncharacterized membrane protein YidH (DUF202 family)